eukprot:TRINITY_DN2085_c0_g1_i1.p1 TRINITY_DN2085_c0_g1~~TRINITY_DN2085_c0_g1_i1.p1  ORF type:complete len:212 (+),score=36.79 TRINITY_DN2085_c0_g1_i1:106-741(+)
MDVEYLHIDKADEFPAWCSELQLVNWLFTNMVPYNDTEQDIQNCLDYVFKRNGEPGESLHWFKRLFWIRAIFRSSQTCVPSTDIVIQLSSYLLPLLFFPPSLFFVSVSVCLSGGFIWLASVEGKLSGALVCLHQSFKGFIPGNIIVFVCVDPELRGKKIGGTLMGKAVEETEGDLCLHVEYDNPAKRLYERVGFSTKYAEMRFDRTKFLTK